jgi:hypothetical protein
VGSTVQRGGTDVTNTTLEHVELSLHSQLTAGMANVILQLSILKILKTFVGVTKSADLNVQFYIYL